MMPPLKRDLPQGVAQTVGMVEGDGRDDGKFGVRRLWRQSASQSHFQRHVIAVLSGVVQERQGRVYLELGGVLVRPLSLAKLHHRAQFLTRAANPFFRILRPWMVIRSRNSSR